MINKEDSDSSANIKPNKFTCVEWHPGMNQSYSLDNLKWSGVFAVPNSK